MISYTVNLNSVDGTGLSANQKTYNFDFSSWEDGAYNLTFTYVGMEDVLDAAHICNVFVNLGTTTVFNTGATNYANTTERIGHLLERGIGGTTERGNYLYAETITNTPIYMYHRPMNQTIEVTLLDETGVLYLDGGGSRPANYLLTLHFQRV